ncbi:MAG TPA: shikimate dehydrogenase [Novosphingobium sp.]|nr:shikimate dehydrogenase [Novosphingobium sp.]
MSRPYAEVIGDPISHSKSPLIHNFWLEKLGIDAEYRACHVRPEELADYFTRRRGDADWRGCNVTIPHKEAVLPFLDTVTCDAQAIGAVNTIRRSEDGRLNGRNTDVNGIWRATDDAAITGERLLLIGAGGAARAAAFALGKRDPAFVTIMNRSVDKAEELLAEFRLLGAAVPIGTAPSVQLIVNATSLGMKGQPPLPVAIDALPATATVFDMVYVPLETKLLHEARKRGLRAVDGLVMLIEQADEAFGAFFNTAPPRQHDAELRALLTS